MKIGYHYVVKKRKINCLKNLAQNLNLLNQLFDEAVGNVLVTPKLEHAHDRFMAVVDEEAMNIGTDPGAFYT